MRIGDREAGTRQIGGLGSRRQPGSPSVMPQGDNRGAAALARALGGLGQNFAQISQHRDREELQRERFDALQKFNQFSGEVAREAEALKEGLPANGAGYTGRVDEMYSKRYSEFAKELRPELQQEFAPRAETVFQNLVLGAEEFTRKATRGYSLNSIEAQVEESQTRVYADPAALDEVETLIGEALATAPGLSALERQKLARKTLQTLRESAFTGTIRSGIESMHAIPFSARVRDEIMPALIQAESSGDPNAISPKGAAGLAQVMPGTGEEIAYELNDWAFPFDGTTAEKQAYLKDPERSILYGTHYLNKQLDRFGGDLELALIAYNAGAKNAQKFLDAGRNYAALPKREETEPYVQRVIANMGGLTEDMALNAGLTFEATVRADAAVQQALAQAADETAQIRAAEQSNTLNELYRRAEQGEDFRSLYEGAVRTGTLPQYDQSQFNTGRAIQDRVLARAKADAAETVRLRKEAADQQFSTWRTAMEAAYETGEEMRDPRVVWGEALQNGEIDRYDQTTMNSLRGIWERRQSHVALRQEASEAYRAGRSLDNTQANALFDEAAQASLAERNGDTLNHAMTLSRHLGFIPSNVSDALKRQLYSTNIEDISFAAQAIKELQRRDPTLTARLDDEVLGRAEAAQTLLEMGVDAQTMGDYLNATRTPEGMRAISEAKKLDTEYAENAIISVDDITSSFASYFDFSDPQAPGPASVQGLMQRHYRSLFESHYAVSRDAGAAKEFALEQLGQRWAPTQTDSSNRLMFLPPEMTLSVPPPSVGTSLKRIPPEQFTRMFAQQVRTQYELSPEQNFRVELTPRTHQQYSAGEVPEYLIRLVDEEGQPKYPETEAELERYLNPPRFRFEYNDALATDVQLLSLRDTLLALRAEAPTPAAGRMMAAAPGLPLEEQRIIDKLLEGVDARMEGRDVSLDLTEEEVQRVYTIAPELGMRALELIGGQR